jgi:hypothetical protein
LNKQVRKTHTHTRIHTHIYTHTHTHTHKHIGDGHFSPIGGYCVERDAVLIMDVARFKYTHTARARVTTL